MYANFAPPRLEPLPSNKAGRSSEGAPSQWRATTYGTVSPTIRTIDSHPAFRRALKTHLFRLAFDNSFYLDIDIDIDIVMHNRSIFNLYDWAL